MNADIWFLSSGANLFFPLFSHRPVHTPSASPLTITQASAKGSRKKNTRIVEKKTTEKDNADV
jgi:hypothetical protein